MMRPFMATVVVLLSSSLIAAKQQREESILATPQPAEERLSLRQPVEAATTSQGAVTVTGSEVIEEVIPAPVEPTIIPVRSIRYVVRPGARRFLAHQHQQEIVLAVDNPQDGNRCLYAVPVCVPACCQAPPTVCPRRGLLGRGVVTHTWPCGFEVEVVFRLRGDVLVRSSAG